MEAGGYMSKNIIPIIIDSKVEIIFEYERRVRIDLIQNELIKRCTFTVNTRINTN